jgi:hypothetical protein
MEDFLSVEEIETLIGAGVLRAYKPAREVAE